MTNSLLSEAELDERLRRTLRAVALTIEEVPPTKSLKRRTPRRTMVGLGAVVVAIPLAAGAVIGFGPEYVDKIPPEGVIVAGSIDGDRYWMVEAFHTDFCDNPEPGVEIVIEDSNIMGQEWSTIGVTYGQPRWQDDGGWCGYDRSRYLGDPSRSNSGGVFMGDAFLWAGGVHPDVTAVRATIDGTAEQVEVHPWKGAGYYVIEVPPDTTEYTVELLIDGEVVPGTSQTRPFPERPPD